MVARARSRPVRRRLIAASVVAAIVAAGSAAAAVPEPVSRYAPRVWLHPDEKYQPASAINFISRSRLVWNRGLFSKDVIDPDIVLGEMARLGAGCAALANCYAAAHGGRTWTSNQHTRPHDRGRGLRRLSGFALEYEGPRQGRGTSAPVYYVYRPGRYVTYWFHYAYSVQAGVGHQGDWERITVMLDASDRAWRMEYAFHGCSDWSGLPDRRPEVYSAKGSHATYLTAGRHTGTCEGTDVTRRGDLWPTWRFLRDAEAEPWYGFGGAWGRVGKLPQRTGPLGPSPYKRDCVRC